MTHTLLSIVFSLPNRFAFAPELGCGTHDVLFDRASDNVSQVRVTTDRSVASEKATGRTVANVHGFHTDLTVALDLRSLPPGTYFLATAHQGNPASYFYPLTVR
jgi:hypothetical protein